MFKFTCSATGELQMLGVNARQLLELIGKEPGERGVITVEEMPAAIAQLQSAGERDRHQRLAEEPVPEKDGDEPEMHFNQVGLGQRAFPMVEMLKRAHAAGAPILWGV